MKSFIKKISQALLLVPVLALSLSLAAPGGLVLAQSNTPTNCDPTSGGVGGGADCARGDDQPGSLFGNNQETGLFKTVVNILLFIVGAIAVIMLIIGGIRYVISGGNQEQVTAAKNTILYAIVGIIVALLAFAVVNFVITGIGGS